MADLNRPQLGETTTRAGDAQSRSRQSVTWAEQTDQEGLHTQ